MNYRHLYHAGNFSDVFKHIVLIALIQKLRQKEVPFCYLETHAGTGLYDLTSNAARKSSEFEEGIQRILQLPNPPVLIQDYFNIVNPLNTSHTLRFYPGSPYIAESLLRPQDRMILCELQKEDFSSLQTLFKNKKNVSCHHQNGYDALKAYLPPPERRGLILIDPSYENANEWTVLSQKILMALKRFETGVYAIWYPIKTRAATQKWKETLFAQIKRPILIEEFCFYPDDVANRLNGCGMLIVNPPWQVEEVLKEAMEWLKS